MGDRRKRALHVQFDGKPGFEFHGAKVIRHARHVTFQMAAVAVLRELLATILERNQWFGVPPPVARDG